MTGLADRSTEELNRLREQALKDYEAFRARGLKLDMTRGNPSPEQLDLSLGMLALPGNGDYHTERGEDARNYGGPVQGLPEARALIAEMMGAPVERHRGRQQFEPRHDA